MRAVINLKANYNKDHFKQELDKLSLLPAEELNEIAEKMKTSIIEVLPHLKRKK